eukprot:CAMPEP_0171743616 /NCGR_PEP_ID=MMETSP0991-20121206/36995_1 /TAXON_ID=483369 /ORGANISM="non described non described, Strain CCMP2098" /LENGTH=172 /DNA_ID=CAMNT_0012342579 /DNA_START=147 /DNA_END=662 /DNA_ORIENTATION=+
MARRADALFARLAAVERRAFWEFSAAAAARQGVVWGVIRAHAVPAFAVRNPAGMRSGGGRGVGGGGVGVSAAACVVTAAVFSVSIVEKRTSSRTFRLPVCFGLLNSLAEAFFGRLGVVFAAWGGGDSSSSSSSPAGSRSVDAATSAAAHCLRSTTTRPKQRQLDHDGGDVVA